MQAAIKPKILECERVASSKQSVHEDKSSISRTSYSGVNVLTTTSKQSGMVDVPSGLKKLPPRTKVNDAAELAMMKMRTKVNSEATAIKRKFPKVDISIYKVPACYPLIQTFRHSHF